MGTPPGLRAIEEAIFAGVPVNVTLLFSAEQYEAAAGAYLRGPERRLAAGRSPAVPSVASLFVSRWDCERVLAEFRAAGIDVDALARQLQQAGATAFVASWRDLAARIEARLETLKSAPAG